jgi:hypothetical protein
MTSARHLPKLNFQKISASFLVFIFVANIIFGFVLIPTKEANAQLPIPLPTAETGTGTWGIKDFFWKAVDTIKQGVQEWGSTISAVTSLWSKAETIAMRLIQSALLLALHTILQMITNEVIKWINGQGEPLFVSDWGTFLRKAANEAGGVFLDTLSGNLLCQPFAFQLRLALMPVSYYQQARCTLESIGRNLNVFFNNFAQGGGWGTWLQIIQPQNNFFGSFGMALDEYEKQKIEAAEKAKIEAMASGGFVGDKKCVSGGLVNVNTGQMATADKCKGAANCQKMKEGMSEVSGQYEFKCTQEAIVTPGTLVREQAQEAMDTMRDTIYSMISGAASQTGPLAPYIMAILSALINRVIKEGLATVSEAIAGGDPSYGPTFSNPNTPMPSSDPRVTGLDPTSIAKNEEILSASPALIDPLGLLKENIETEILAKQQQNLNILISAKNTQIETLNKFKDVLENNCVLPSWASSQIISSNTTNGVTTEIIKITAGGVGNVTIKTASSSLGVSYEITETNAEAAPQVDAKQAEVNNTQTWANDAGTAIAANRNAIAAAEEFAKLYKEAGDAPSPSQQTALDAAKKKMADAYDVTLAATKKAGKSTENDLTLLLADIQERTIETLDLGRAEEDKTSGYNAMLTTAQTRKADIEAHLAACLAAPPP